MLTLATMRNLIRSSLNESTTTSFTDAELNTILNSGYVDVAVKGLCYERQISKTDISSSIRMIPIATDNIIKINQVEYDFGSGCRGMLQVFPQTIGHTLIDTYVPQYWFRWNDYLTVEPLPDAGTYDLNIYAACYPTTAMSADGDTAALLPLKFQECVYMYGIAFALFKLSRWADAIMAYNKYIESVQSKKFEYIIRPIEDRNTHELPARVTEG
jgi:hypothetical protein